jgi:large subunit ribosomal protein L31
MKKGIHPENYRTVVFKDMSNDYSFLSRSTANTKETTKWEDGKEYPLIKIEVSSKSHPFYTGKAQFVDTAGRIDKFRQKYGKFKQGTEAAPEAVVEVAVEAAPEVVVEEAPEAPESDETTSSEDETKEESAE